jgi:hypothetical protein
MFRTLASSLITLIAILLFAFVMLFLWSGSEGIQFTRATFEGDKTTVAVLEEYRRANMAATEVAMKDDGGEEKEMTDEPAATNSGDGPAVVVWINIPGFRGDYLEKAEAPFLKKLATDGAATNKMRPSFPCLTYPSHTTMATGVTPDKHGIIADRIRTPAGEIIDKPMDPALLLAEPIWITATRQGIKTLVHDWPLSQNQTSEHKAAYFHTSYDPDSKDDARLTKALEQWRASAGGAAAPVAPAAAPADGAAPATAPVAPAAPAAAPAGGGGDKLRLVMLRLNDIFREGLLHGPRADETFAAVGATDKALQTFFDTIQAEWATLAPPSANLVIFITTDHGLAELDKNVNIGHLLGPDMMKNCDIVAHDAVANLFFKGLPENEGREEDLHRQVRQRAEQTPLLPHPEEGRTSRGLGLPESRTHRRPRPRAEDGICLRRQQGRRARLRSHRGTRILRCLRLSGRGIRPHVGPDLHGRLSEIAAQWSARRSRPAFLPRHDLQDPRHPARPRRRHRHLARELTGKAREIPSSTADAPSSSHVPTRIPVSL